MAGLDQGTGIVVFQPFRDLSSKRLRLSHAEADAKLLFFLSYFERVATFPFNTTGILTSTELEQTLAHQHQVKVLVRPRWQYGDFDETMWSSLANEVFDAMNLADGPAWAVSPPAEAWSGVAEGPVNSLVISMERCLPCPHPGVPAAEILAFRAEYGERLGVLRRALDDVYFSIGRGSEEDARRILQNRIGDAVRQTHDEFKKSGLRFFKGSLKVGLQVLSPMLGKALAAGVGVPGLGEIAGGAIAVAAEHSALAVPRNSSPRDFEYVLTGIRRGLLEAFPDEEPQELDADMLVGHNISKGQFPVNIQAPRKLSGTNQRNVDF
jgi:hypothetical protein